MGGDNVLIITIQNRPRFQDKGLSPFTVRAGYLELLAWLKSAVLSVPELELANDRSKVTINYTGDPDFPDTESSAVIYVVMDAKATRTQAVRAELANQLTNEFTGWCAMYRAESRGLEVLISPIVPEVTEVYATQ